jgi:GT2 family glycosyltransferase
MSKKRIISIYVSHKSDEFINKFGRDHKSELGDSVYVVNSSACLSTIDESLGFNVIEANENVGFSAANNIAVHHCKYTNSDYLLFINPDVSLPQKWLTNVIDILNDPKYSDTGIFTVPLLGYDFDSSAPTGTVDSLGVSHTWYGRWYDISKGCDANSISKDASPYEIQAACGALMLINKDVISALLNKDGYIFNESYFMYKEDIELSIRVRKLGKKIMMIPSLPAYHCRGWANKRRDSPYWARELSARNELRMHSRYYWRYIPYSLFKYLYVRFIEYRATSKDNIKPIENK